MSNPTHYETLEVSQTATSDEIKQAYRKLARRYHPDINKAPGSEEKMKAVNSAYDVLSDPQKRAEYDRFGSHNYQQGYQQPYQKSQQQYYQTYTNMDDLFAQLFRQQYQQQQYRQQNQQQYRRPQQTSFIGKLIQVLYIFMMIRFLFWFLFPF